MKHIKKLKNARKEKKVEQELQVKQLEKIEHTGKSEQAGARKILKVISSKYMAYRLKVLSLTLVMTLCMGLFTGCNDTLKAFSKNAHGAIENRFSNTLSSAEALYKSNLISENTYNKIQDNYNNLTKALGKLNSLGDELSEVKKLDTANEKIHKVLTNKDCNLVNALSAVRPLGGLTVDKYNVKPGADKVYGKSKDVLDASKELRYNVVSNYVLWQELDVKKEDANDAVGSHWIVNSAVNSSGNIPSCGIPIVSNGAVSKFNHTFEPIQVVPNSVKEELEENLGFPIYVLKANLDTNLGGDYNLDSITKTIQNALQSKDTATLDKYFEKASSKELQTVTIKSILEDNGVTVDDLIITTTWNDSAVNSPGKDIVITQGTDPDVTPIMSIRIQEFNEDTVEKLSGATGLFNDGGKYRIIDGRVYLVEYPVYAIEGFEVTGNTSNTTTVNASYALSGFGLNIDTGRMINYTTDNSGNILQGGTYIEIADPYYTSALFGDNANNTSFACVGSSPVPMQIGGKKYKVGTSEAYIARDYNLYSARIVLKDYLEATYSPSYSSGSNINTFGRKIRLSITNHVQSGNIVYTTGENIARYVDRDGNTLDSADTLKVSDFCDIHKLSQSPPVVYRVVPQNHSPAKMDAVENTESAASAISELAEETTNSRGAKIKACSLFKGQTTGESDFKTGVQDKQIMWQIAVNEGLYSNSLMQSWIDPEDTRDNLSEWNKYLSDNGYEYSVNKGEVIDYLKSMYTTQVQANGILMIDKDTIKDVSKLYEHEDNVARASAIRTSFLVIGWALMCLAVIIMLAWAADTNTDLGLNILGKITFGHWTAVKYSSDIPVGRNDEHSYLSFQKLCIRSFILILVGFLLINVDVFKIAAWLIREFGQIATTIERIIRGD